jgi:hypothetical protein
MLGSIFLFCSVYGLFYEMRNFFFKCKKPPSFYTDFKNVHLTVVKSAQ